MEMAKSFVYPAPPSILLNGMSVVGLAALAKLGWSEVRGNHLKYSKFTNASPPQKNRFGNISSRTGMLWFYTPAFLAAAASFFIVPSDDLRFLLLKSAISLHFLKRVFEVMFIHKYSGGTGVESVFTITSSYFSSTVLMLYSQSFTLGLTEPAFDMKFAGILMFVVGIVGNLYHHMLLAKLRNEDGKKEYKIPQGGLFGIIICPHYLFEILVFWSFFLISQTIYTFSFAMGTTFYLVGRSYATRSWYLSKFDDFPKHVKALVPFLF